MPRFPSSVGATVPVGLEAHTRENVEVRQSGDNVITACCDGLRDKIKGEVSLKDMIGQRPLGEPCGTDAVPAALVGHFADPAARQEVWYGPIGHLKGSWAISMWTKGHRRACFT